MANNEYLKRYEEVMKKNEHGYFVRTSWWSKRSFKSYNRFKNKGFNSGKNSERDIRIWKGLEMKMGNWQWAYRK